MEAGARDAAHHSHSPEAEVNVLLKKGSLRKELLEVKSRSELPQVIPRLCDISFAWEHQEIIRYIMHLRKCLISGGLVNVN